MATRNLDSARIIVTGASSGIGAALTQQLAALGARLIITARREDRLRHLAHAVSTDIDTCAPITVAGDVTDTAVQHEIIKVATRNLGGLDILINNAGIGALGPFDEALPERLRRVMEVNFFGPVELTRQAIPLLRTGNKPLIVNIGSILGHRAVPGKSEYCASKFALHGFSDALRCELVNDGIDVLLISPSTTSSEFFDHVIDASSTDRTVGAGAMSPERVARHTVQAIQRGRHELILTTGGKLLVWLDRLCPPLANRIVSRFG